MSRNWCNLVTWRRSTPDARVAGSPAGHKFAEVLNDGQGMSYFPLSAFRKRNNPIAVWL